MSKLLSRRDFQELACRSIATTICSVSAASLIASGVAEQDAQDLVKGVRWLGRHVAAQSAAVQDWLRNSVIVASSRASSFHEKFSNTNQFSGPPLQVLTRFGHGNFGVNGDPWLGNTNYSAAVTLNNAEINSLLPTVSVLRDEISLYLPEMSGLMVCPFAKGPRQPPTDERYRSFARLVVRSRLDLDDFNLKYCRYFVLKAADAAMKMSNFTPIIAYAYVRRGSPQLRLAYTML